MISWFKKYWPLLLLILGNLILKGIFLGNNALGGDEPFSVYHAQCSIPAIVKFLSETNNPPLYEIFLHYWIRFFGISEIAVRIPSLVFNTITLIFIYLTGVKFFSKTVGMTAATLFVFSTYQVVFAHEARVYALFGMLTAVSMYFFIQMILNGKTKSNFLLLIAFDGLLLYTHYFGFFVPVIQAIVVLTSKSLRSEFLKPLFYAGFILFLCYLPNLVVLVTRFKASAGGTWVPAPNGFESLYNMLWKFSNEPVVTVIIILLFVIVLVKKISFDRKTKVSIGARIIMIWFFFPFLFMFLISYRIPVFLDRYLMFVSVGFYLLVALAIKYLVRNQVYLLVIPFICCLLFAITVEPNISNKRKVRETVAKIKEIQNDSTLVIVCPHYFSYNLAYYYNREIFRKTSETDDYQQIDSGLNRSNIYCIDNIKAVDLTNRKHVVYLDAAADFCSPGNEILPTLVNQYQTKSCTEFYEIFKVYEFGR
ncbi:MAG: glycosyltransferase family 39 protein [Syntrophothermus sp.]